MSSVLTPMVLAAKMNPSENKDTVSLQNFSLKKTRITSELEMKEDT